MANNKTGGSAANGSTANLGFEARLWPAADKLRNNMDAAEYKNVVLGLIFLKYISDSSEDHHAKLKATKGDDAAGPSGHTVPAFAELRALQRKVMTMRDWITKLDDFLKLSEHELLDHAGKISAEQAKMKAELEYERYRVFVDSQPRLVDLDFEKAASKLKNLPKPKNPKPPKP
jgi:type I restriction-modification system DNA methylase subunit